MADGRDFGDGTCGWRIGKFWRGSRLYGAGLCRLAGVIISTHARSAPPGDPSARYPRETPRPGRRAPNLTMLDRLVLGLTTLFGSPHRIPKLSASLKPATLLTVVRKVK